MSVRGPLAITVDDGTTNRAVTRYVDDLTFSKTAPGGHKAASMDLNVPRDYFTDLGPADRVWITDTRTGQTVWGAGYLENPTPIDGPTGLGYQLSAFGGMLRAADETRPLLYIDRALTSWQKTGDSLESSTVENVQDPPRLRLQINAGQPIGTNGLVAAEQLSLRDSDMTSFILYFTTTGGKNDADYHLEIATRDPDSVGAGIVPLLTTPVFYSASAPSASRRPQLRLIRTGAATNVADNLTYIDLSNLSITGQLVNRYGVNDPSSLSNFVRPEGVVADALGRLLRFCDPATAIIQSTGVTIDQLAFPDGATAQRVLDELAGYAPDYLWEILEDGPGGHRFAYRAWPTDPRYVVSTRDGYVESGTTGGGLCNRIAVSWTDPTGKAQTTIVTATSYARPNGGQPDGYPALRALEDASRVRDADPVTLPSGKGSVANALRIGRQVLAGLANPNRSATVTISRPILDLYTGALVWPHELLPGYPVRVRELGTNLRLTEMTYTDQTCSALLALGDPLPTLEQRVAALAAV